MPTGQYTNHHKCVFLQHQQLTQPITTSGCTLWTPWGKNHQRNSLGLFGLSSALHFSCIVDSGTKWIFQTLNLQYVKPHILPPRDTHTISEIAILALGLKFWEHNALSYNSLWVLVFAHNRITFIYRTGVIIGLLFIELDSWCFYFLWI